MVRVRTGEGQRPIFHILPEGHGRGQPRDPSFRFGDDLRCPVVGDLPARRPVRREPHLGQQPLVGVAPLAVVLKQPPVPARMRPYGCLPDTTERSFSSPLVFYGGSQGANNRPVVPKSGCHHRAYPPNLRLSPETSVES